MHATLSAAMVSGELLGGAGGGDSEKRMLEVANLLREYGVRLRICEKNTGRPSYAFNAIQREFLPFPYKPPPSTIQDLTSSLIHRDVS
mmetsp:Transcript_19342/g.60552  ORF Transcript_19342/g.60552 Transcript_19342/m.60552 type:complete len:88 (-) Transcript_19342:505-768(-)